MGFLYYQVLPMEESKQYSPIRKRELPLNFGCEVSYFAKDMLLWEERLKGLELANNRKEIRETLDHLYEQLFIQKTLYNKLISDIYLFQTEIDSQHEKNKLNDVDKPELNHESLKEELEKFKKLYSQFKVSIMDFTAKWI